MLLGGVSTGNGTETNYSFYDSIVFMSPAKNEPIFPFKPF